jgi:hypothetical protein
MSLTMSLISASLRERSLGDFAPFRTNSSEAAAFANRCPRACISNRSVFVSETADSKDVLPLAALKVTPQLAVYTHNSTNRHTSTQSYQWPAR